MEDHAQVELDKLRDYVSECSDPLLEWCLILSQAMEPHAPGAQMPGKRKAPKTSTIGKWAHKMALLSGAKGYDVVVQNIKRFYSHAA